MKIFYFSLIAGILTLFAFIIGFNPDPKLMLYYFLFELIYIVYYSIGMILFIVGIMLSILNAALLSPWAYFCLQDKNLAIALPLLYIAGILGTIIIANSLYRFIGFDAAFLPASLFINLFWILALLLAKFLAPEAKENDAE